MRPHVALFVALFALLSAGLMPASAVGAASSSAASAMDKDKDEAKRDNGDDDGDDGDDGDDDDDDDDDSDDSDDSDDDWRDGRLQLLTTALPAMLPGQQGWVGLNWTATTDVCNIEVTASSSGASVAYPSNTGAFSSLYINDALAKTNLDYTSFQVTMSPSARRSTSVTLRASYTKIPPGRVAKSDNLRYKTVACDGGVSATETVTVALPYKAASGPQAVLETTTTAIPARTPTWVSLSFTTNYSGLNNFRVTLAPPEGLTVVYPGEGTSAGLTKESSLPAGGRDAAAVQLEASTLAPGTYQVPVRASWTGGSIDSTLALTVR